MVNAMKKLRKYSSIILVLLIFFSSSNIALANNIESIDIKADIQKDGSVIITDHRIFNATKGTEHFLTFGNLGDSELLEFAVYERGQKLQDVGSWDVNKSISEKAGKYGVNKTSDGFELCFGIGSLGKKDFTIVYRLSNFVRKLEDNKQAVYWYFIQPDMDPISNINISVTNKSGLVYKFPDTKLWGFGFEGTTEIKEKELLLKSKGSFTKSNYVVMLSIFPEGTFDTTASYPYDEEGIKENAMQGATLNEGNSRDIHDDEDYQGSDNYKNHNLDSNFESVENSGSSFFDSFPFSISMANFLTRPLIIMAILFFIFRKISGKNNKFGKARFKPTVDRDYYYRDIPYDGDVTEIAYLLHANAKEYVSSYILKWIHEGRLKDEKEMTGFIFKRETLALVINPSQVSFDTTPQERELWYMVKKASGDDGILSEKEFTKYMSRHISRFNDWVDDVSDRSNEVLTNKGFFAQKDKKFLFFKYKSSEITQKGQTLLDNIVGFKNYLLDFSLLSERDVGDVRLWEKYMIWAAMLDITKEVYDQLKIVNPEMISSMNYDYQTILMTNSFANTISSTQSSLNSSSSFGGGGGSSFSGGGGGASGGSSGGGTR